MRKLTLNDMVRHFVGNTKLLKPEQKLELFKLHIEPTSVALDEKKD
jgi:hypothetical protein